MMLLSRIYLFHSTHDCVPRSIPRIGALPHPWTVAREIAQPGTQGENQVKNIRVPHVPALEPLSLYTVEFTTPEQKKQPSEKLTRTVAGTDEIDVANAVHRYFAVDRINSITRQGNVYLTANRLA
jgi:hypothetical protein